MTFSSTELRQVRDSGYETKFAIAPTLAAEIKDWAQTNLSPDPNATGDSDGGYRITSLYFDTAAFDVYHRRGSFGRSKYRIRRYGDSETVFLERKLKNRGLVSKWRTPVPMDELDRLGDTTPEAPWNGDWYQRRIQARRLNPVCQISYQRTARVADTPSGAVRLTMDHEIQAVPVEGPAFQPQTQAEFVSDGRVILELKYAAEPPVLFKRLMEQFKLTAQPVSKYRLAAQALGYPLCQSS